MRDSVEVDGRTRTFTVVGTYGKNLILIFHGSKQDGDVHRRFTGGSFDRLAGDGGTVMLGLQNEREWAAFCDKVLEQPELAGDARFSANFKRSENREVLRAIILEAFSRLTAEQVIERLERAQIANAHVNDMAGVWSHPQLAARQRWSQVASPAGTLPALLPPAANSAFAPRMDAIPALGEHSATLLAELGYAAADIERLRQQGAV